MYEPFELLYNYRTAELRREASNERLAQLVLAGQRLRAAGMLTILLMILSIQ